MVRQAPAKPTLYLLDGTAQLYRAYFAIRGLSTEAGLPTNATYGFTTMLRKLLAEERPDAMAVAWDLPGKVFRHERFPEYKANRPPTPEDLRAQLPYAREVSEVLGIRSVALEGYEADDVIATLARRGIDAGFDVVIVASDKDLLQLVGPGVTLLNPSKELRLDEEGVTSFFGVPPGQVLDVLALMGDSVDNIPGVPGVGGKTAVACVAAYGGLESVIRRAERFVKSFEARDALVEAIDRALKPGSGPSTPADLQELRTTAVAAFSDLLEVETDDAAEEKWKAALVELERAAPDPAGDATAKETAKRFRSLKKVLKSMDRGSNKRSWQAIHSNADQARLSRELATLNDRAPLEIEPSGLSLEGPDPDKARALFDSLEFKNLVAELDAQGGKGADNPVAEQEAELVKLSDERSLARWSDECRGTGRVALHAATDGADPRRAKLVGLSLCFDERRAATIPLAEDSAPRLTAALAPLLADPGVSKVAHDLKQTIHVLQRHGLSVEGWQLDTMVAAFLLNPGKGGYPLDTLAGEYLGQAPPPVESAPAGKTGRLSFDETDIETLSRDSAQRALTTLRLGSVLRQRLDAAGLAELYTRIDGPLLPLLARMEERGIRVDVSVLEQMAGEMQRTIDEKRTEIHRLAGHEFNIDSPKQLREVLFERLGLKSRRKTAKNKVLSTDAQTLEDLAQEHPIARELLDYRELTKLKGTYVDTLPKLVDSRTGRVHTSYHPTGAATGRLSSSDPNLQNIPTRTDSGRRIRRAFVPDDGHRFLASDYSQVELRVLAHLSGDESMIAAFRDGEDIHRHTASRVFDVSADLVTAPMRQRAKAVNFGILYGMSETRLAREQGMKRAEAREFIHSYFERFSKVRGYIDDTREQALRDGAVRTMFGRVRYFPQLRQRVNRAVQEAALRAAVNTTIQGTAADLMKLAMLQVEAALNDERAKARILLQVHDELLLEVPESELKRVSAVVREAMETVHPLDVPLVADQKVGSSWFEVS